MNTKTSTMFRGIAALSALSLVSAGSILGATAASPMETTLCAGVETCSIMLDQHVAVEGETITVDLVGAPGATVDLKFFSGAPGEADPGFGDPVTVTLGADGKLDDVELVVPPLAYGPTGGEAQVSVADWDLAEDGKLQVDNFAYVTTHAVITSGDDGTYTQKANAKGEVNVTLAYIIPGLEYLMQVKIGDGWEVLDGQAKAAEGGWPADATFTVPDRIPAGTYTMRIINGKTGDESDEYQLVIPEREDVKKPSKPAKPAKPAKPGKKPSLPKTGV